MELIETAPKQLRTVLWVLAAVGTIAGATGGAYAAVTYRASEIAESRDAVIQKDLADHKEGDRREFDQIGRLLERIEAKIDHLQERGR